MNIFYNLLFKNSIKSKIYRIKKDTKKIIKAKCNEKFWIYSYGAYEIDPKHLVIWICVQTDKMKNELAVNSEVNESLRLLLEKNNYPDESRNSVFIGFESQETVDRESDGNWYHHFK